MSNNHEARIVEISLSHIEPVPAHIAYEQGLRNSLETLGLLHPIGLQKIDQLGFDWDEGQDRDEQGRGPVDGSVPNPHFYRVVYGRRRYKALYDIDPSASVPAVVWPASADQAVLSLAENLHQHPNTVSAIQDVLALERQGLSEEEIAQQVQSTRWALRRLKRIYADLLPELWAEITAGNIPADLAERLSRATHDIQQNCLTRYRETGQLTSRDVADLSRPTTPTSSEPARDVTDLSRAATPASSGTTRNAFNALCASRRSWCWRIQCTTCGCRDFRNGLIALGTGYHPDTRDWTIATKVVSSLRFQDRNASIGDSLTLYRILASASISRMAQECPFPDYLGYLGLVLHDASSLEWRFGELTVAWGRQLLEMVQADSTGWKLLQSRISNPNERLAWYDLETVESSMKTEYAVSADRVR